MTIDILSEAIAKTIEYLRSQDEGWLDDLADKCAALAADRDRLAALQAEAGWSDKLSKRLVAYSNEIDRLAVLQAETARELAEEREACAKIAQKRADGFHTGDCERGHIEWDTNAFVCSSRGDCLCLEREEEAEAIAAAIRDLPIDAALKQTEARRQIAQGPFRFAMFERVRKVGGSYQLDGIVRARFETAEGALRYVVDHEPTAPGLLHIYQESQLAAIDAALKQTEAGK